jgi:hypothetical protein
MTLLQRATAEIIDFHRFFVAWYEAGTAGSVDFGRCEQVFGEGFQMIPPTGRVFGRAETIALIAANRATFHGDFAIDIDEIRPAWEAEGAILVTYVERQQRAGINTARRATALFSERSSAPHGVEWRHLHETWMQTAEN